jgi:predicted RNA binding protein YcfA (HicA-like mRNA interferase family)
MSQGLPSVNAKDVLRALQRAGFFVHRSSGSHYVLKHDKDPTLRPVVPYRGSKALRPGTLRSILKQANLTVEEFKKLL